MNVAPPPWVERSRVCLCFFTKIIFIFTIHISMRKIILEVEYFIKSMIYQMLKFFKRMAYFILRPLFCLKVRKNTGLWIFTSFGQKKLIFNLFINRNWKKLTDSRERAETLADKKAVKATTPLRPSEKRDCSQSKCSGISLGLHS